jgi:hypothetical protein
MKTIHISLDEFLATEKPWEFLADRLESQPDGIVPESDLLALRNAMPLMDDSHLACALPIAEYTQPLLFADLSARLLSHSSMSVRVNAYRVLRAIREESIDESLRRTVTDHLKQCPEAEHFSDALARP